jgi:hypothetical protein
MILIFSRTEQRTSKGNSCPFYFTVNPALLLVSKNFSIINYGFDRYAISKLHADQNIMCPTQLQSLLVSFNLPNGSFWSSAEELQR